MALASCRDTSPLPFRGGAGGGESPPSATPQAGDMLHARAAITSHKGSGLTLGDTARRNNTPPLQGTGKGWGLDANALAELQRRARAMRNNPTEPEKRLWRRLSNGQLNGFKFRRQHVIGWWIADFACPSARLIVEVDGDTHDDPVKDARRDAHLAAFGYRALHIANDAVMRDADGVVMLIGQALAEFVSPHPNPSPEGEGLAGVGVNAEGSAA